MDDPGRKARVAVQGNGAQAAADGAAQLPARRSLVPLPASSVPAETVEGAGEAPLHTLVSWP